MKFSEMKYKRPDAEKIKATLISMTERLKNAENYGEAKKVFLENEKFTKHILTMHTLSSIRNSIDTRDAFYDKEEKFWNSMLPPVQEVAQQWTKTLLASPFRADFEKEYGEIMFSNAEMELKTFSPSIIPELQKENDLIQEYETLLASAQIKFGGNSYTLAQLFPFKNDENDDVRRAAWTVEGRWYAENSAELDRLYDDLVVLRDIMGKRLGYKDYTQLGYYRMCRNSYTKVDIEKFREAVVKYLVPVADRIYRNRAKSLGVGYPLSYADSSLVFRSGNPRPLGTADDILKAGMKFYGELSKETAEFFKTMLDDELLDVLAKEGKRAGGYCTTIYDYEVPFIFANFNGTADDVETVTHEAGHAFADWYNRKRVPISTIWPTLEACEVHSMSMEFFAWNWSEEFFGKDAEKFKYAHLSDALTFIPYGTLVDHFQHIVYEDSEMTPDERHEVWQSLQEIYMPWMRLDGDIPFYAEGKAWQRQHHIYSSPFYYIDYCLAQTVALQFWTMIQKDIKDAWSHYMAYTEQGGSKVFTELLKNAGLKSPFDSECLREVCEEAERWLAEHTPF